MSASKVGSTKQTKTRCRCHSVPHIHCKNLFSDYRSYNDTHKPAVGFPCASSITGKEALSSIQTEQSLRLSYQQFIHREHLPFYAIKFVFCEFRDAVVVFTPSLACRFVFKGSGASADQISERFLISPSIPDDQDYECPSGTGPESSSMIRASARLPSVCQVLHYQNYA